MVPDSKEKITIFAISRQHRAALARQGDRRFFIELPVQVFEIPPQMAQQQLSTGDFAEIEVRECEGWHQAVCTTAGLVHDENLDVRRDPV